MTSPFGATSTAGLMADPNGIISDKKLFSVASISLDILPWNVRLQRKCIFRVKAAKECNFNKDGSSTNKLQDGMALTMCLKLLDGKEKLLGTEGKNLNLQPISIESLSLEM